jgi:hypothetical protein
VKFREILDRRNFHKTVDAEIKLYDSARQRRNMAARKRHQYGTVPCERCNSEGGFWRNLVWMLCEACGGRGWRRI